MKHFDQPEVARLEPEIGSLAAIDIGEKLGDPETRSLIQLAINCMDLGVIFWDQKGRCELASDRAGSMLEIEDYGLKRGDRRSDFLQHAIANGALTAEELPDLEDALAEGIALTLEHATPSGRIIRSKLIPRADHGYVVLMNDITSFREVEAQLFEDKERAEKVERKLGAELARLNREKAQVESRQEELQRLSLVAAHAKDLIVITDATNRIVWANEAFRRHNGLDLEMDLLGKSGRDVLAGPESDPEKLALIDEAVRNRQSVMLEMICYRRIGDPYWMEQEIIPVFNDKGAHTNFIIVGRDVSERKRAEVAAAEAQRFEQTKREESRMMAEFNEWLQSSNTLDELFVVVSSFLEKLIPESNGAVYTYSNTRETLQRSCTWGDSNHVEDFEPHACWALRRGRPYFYGGNTIDIPCDHVLAGHTHGEGAPEQHCCLPIVAHGETVGLLSVELPKAAGTDTQKLVSFCAEHISLAMANVKMRDLLREQSTRDLLTGLYNRRYFLDYARRELSRCAAQNRPAALISLDVDHFKRFNDTYGHEAGDAVLQSVARVLQKLFRDVDVPCRYGGEEFIVLMPGCGPERAKERAEQLRAAVEALQLRHSGESLSITVSIGLSMFTDPNMNVQDLLAHADDALYAAKAAGRNKVMTKPQS